MRQEAEITINGTRLTDHESAIVRMALASFDDILANQLGSKDDGIAVTDRYQSDTAHVRALLEPRKDRAQ
jgi:hypothetical protein